MFIVERTQNPLNAFQDFDELATKWILEGN
jgi:hypothetical protein